MISALIAIAILLEPPLPSQTPALAPGAIQGIVCDVENCKPVAGARLLLQSAGSRGVRRTAISDRTGIFRFTEIVPGRYEIRAEADDFTTVGIPPLITVPSGGLVQDLTIKMRGTGTISGHAYDVNGEPLIEAHVEAMWFRQEFALRMLVPIASTDTDDRGEFRIAGLDPQDYYIRITPPSNGVESYSPAFYPLTSNPADAQTIKVQAGTEASGIDVRLPSRGVKVRGAFVGAGDGNERGIPYLIPRSPSIQVQPTLALPQPTHDFEIRGVAAGSYYLYAVTNPNMQGLDPGRSYRIPPQWARVPIEVGDKDIDDLRIPIVPTGSIRGRVLIASDAADTEKIDLSKVLVGALSTEITPSPTAILVANVSSTGYFEFPQASEMTLFLHSILLDGWFVSRLQLDGRDVMGSGFSSTPAKESVLEITISNTSGTLAGMIKDQREKPVRTGRVVLLPDRSLRANPSLIRTEVASENGEFTIVTLPPGDYVAIAFPDEDQFTPAFLHDLRWDQSYERFGQYVHIDAGQTTHADLVTVNLAAN